MPGHHWSDHITPDDPRWEHYNKEEDLEDEIAEQRDILKRMEDEIIAIRMEEDERIYAVENRRIYRQANHRLNLAIIALEDHHTEHGSYHSLRPRRPRPNILSDEQIAAREAEQRINTAPGGSVRRNSTVNRALVTSPIQTPPRSGPRLLTIGGGSAFASVDRRTRSPVQEPSQRSPRRLPPIVRETGRVRTVPRNHTGDVRRGELQSSPGNNDGRRPGNRGTGTAEREDGIQGLTGQQLQFGDDDVDRNTFKPTLKF